MESLKAFGGDDKENNGLHINCTQIMCIVCIQNGQNVAPVFNLPNSSVPLVVWAAAVYHKRHGRSNELWNFRSQELSIYGTPERENVMKRLLPGVKMSRVFCSLERKCRETFALISQKCNFSL